MLERLSERLDAVIKKVSGRGRIRESDIKAAMREVRVALLEADVQLGVARDFVRSVGERAVGREVLSSVSPRQQLIK
ncbi:MAG: signal recognition particle receptor subunit alpha, partial [Chloroflexota bacterium]|nr:signal recognition particle receptor subunit alpha [Chloroflexota bacterium]